MDCRFCGRETDGRHRICWRCRRGLPGNLTNDAPLVCVCDFPDPVELGGIWAAVHAVECRQCRRPVISQPNDEWSAPR